LELTDILAIPVAGSLQVTVVITPFTTKSIDTICSIQKATFSQRFVGEGSTLTYAARDSQWRN